ncbi:MAG: aldehyde dehydrogenase [Flavobacteriaceae bacterium]|nr:aldehyde dehydrogenase [Flavobacteriaceae bacterium]
MQHLVETQRTYFNTQATKPISFRKKQLKLLRDVLKQHEELLYDAIYDDFKKSEFETYVTELNLLYHEIRVARKQLSQWAARTSVSTGLMNLPGKSYIIKEPLGVCLVIGAWNYPYQLSLAPVIAAMAAGNTVILKPSELPGNTSSVMAKLLNNAFDPAYLKVVEGGVPETTALLEQEFDKIFFTGSTKVGQIVYKAAAKTLTPVTLELGGKSPAIVMEDCDLKMTAKRLVWAKFLNAGQTCIAPDYVMVHESVAMRFLEACKTEIENARYAFEHDNYVQIINDDNYQRLKGLINAEQVYYGGRTHREERYIQPTLLQHVTFDDAVMQEEIFGPILPVLTYTKLDDALRQIACLPKPLSCYVFTKSRKKKHHVLGTLSFGGGAVNEAVMHISNLDLPFGGVGHSGMGSYHGEAGFNAFSHQKSILEKPTWFELPLKYPPYSKSKLKWIKRLMRFS